MDDAQRIDWLENNQGKALVSSDFGHWAVVEEGMQSIPVDIHEPSDMSTTFFIEKDQWKKTVREAIDHAMKEGKDD